MKKITVLISDDHTVVREGLRLLLSATDDIEVIGEAEDGHHALDEARRLQPDVVLMDLAMPLLNGAEAVRRIAREVPTARVLILSNYSDDQHVQQAVGAGASGYLMKEAASKDLFRAIRETRKGNAFFSPAIASRLLKQWQERDPKSTTSGSPTLTGRQTEVVQLIAEGYSSKQIAGVLCVSIKTVEKHRQSLMSKLDIHEIASLTRYAVAHGLVESNYAPDWLGAPASTPRPAGTHGFKNHSLRLSATDKKGIGPVAAEQRILAGESHSCAPRLANGSP